MICGIVMIILVACLGYCLDRRIKQLADGVRTRRIRSTSEAGNQLQDGVNQ